MVAKSPLSPVAKALESMLSELSSHGFEIHVIFAEREPEAGVRSWMKAAHFVAWARDPRLLEAHEQLVVGRSLCWYGDSMRRDTDKSDLHEQYVQGQQRAIATAARWFEQLSRLCLPVKVRRVTGSLRAMAPAVAAVAAGQGEAAPAETGRSTRH
ncbi:MAG: hypothetical protein F9K44_14730 [Hyphomicrobiaceae bacterium]|nr:MAG: hypothetical protein F9K44_14730 [Hyphomicrobiaceae bacterium]